MQGIFKHLRHYGLATESICTVEKLGKNYFVEVYQTCSWFVYASLWLP